MRNRDNCAFAIDKGLTMKCFENRAKQCNDHNPCLCFISLEPLSHSDIAFVYNSEYGCSVPIHKKFNTAELRQQWLKFEKGQMLEASERILGKEAADYIERTFPKK